MLHVSSVGLDKAMDEEIWDYARENGYSIVTRDVDFAELAALRGFPPRIIWIRRGNCSTQDVERLLRQAAPAIGLLEEDEASGVLELH